MKTRALLIASFALFAGCGDPTYGDMPALCASDGVCPDGYDCIHGVCALPGTPVPITVARVGSIRGVDMQLVAQTQSALVTWQSYAYSTEGQKFVGARVRADGSVSPRMDIVGRFVAEDDSLEPYYHVLSVAENRLLVAISAASLPDEASVLPRLITYRVDLPPEGNESSAPAFEAAWGEEKRLDTVGYGAVSVPRLLNHASSIFVGYVRSRTTATATVADLALFQMQDDGTLKAPDPIFYPVRTGLSVAVGVWGAYHFSGGSWWVLDDERPSALYLLNDGTQLEAKLGRLAVPVAVDGSSLIYIEPSPRIGEKLPSSLVAGPAELRRVDVVDIGSNVLEAQETVIAQLPTVRDMPRPVWLTREGKTPLLITTGDDAFGSNIFVYTVDPLTGASQVVRSIPRYSTLLLEGLQAAVVQDKLYIAWLETDPEFGTIRAAVVPEP